MASPFGVLIWRLLNVLEASRYLPGRGCRRYCARGGGRQEAGHRARDNTMAESCKWYFDAHFDRLCVALYQKEQSVLLGSADEYMMLEKGRAGPTGRRFRLNMVALLSILSMLVLTYYIKDVNADGFGDTYSSSEVNSYFGEEELNGQSPLHFGPQDTVAEQKREKSEKKKRNKNKKNIIMMVTDGTGPSSINMARTYNQYVNDLNFDDILMLDKYLIGQSRTMSSSSLITDSAAGATAFSCGLKSYNGAIAVDPMQRPCGTILEALKLKGYKTGMVVTTSLTDATPAAFSSHADFRSMQDLIANQQLGLNATLGEMVDLLIGGGRCFFLPQSDEAGCRSDELNLVEFAKKQGWDVSVDRAGFDKLGLGLNKDVKLPVLSLLAYYNIPYEIDRDEKVFPSLYEETVTALNILSRETEDSDEGFFLMVEGSRIDHAGHHNDPHAQVREVLAYDKAFSEVIRFAQNSDVETYIVSTSDHETGGLDVGRQIGPDYPDYVWYPEVLKNAKHSGEYLNAKINRYLSQSKEIKRDKLKSFIQQEILSEDLGITDFEEVDVKSILKMIVKEEQAESEEDGFVTIKEVTGASEVVEYLKNMVSVRARIGWSTHGHTGVDVNIYGYCNREEGQVRLLKGLGGSRENTDIGRFLEQVAGVDLDDLSAVLRGRGQVHNYLGEEGEERSEEEIEEEIDAAEVDNEGFINVVE